MKCSSSSSSSSQDNIRNFLQWIEQGQQQQQHQRPLLVSVQPSTVAIRSGAHKKEERESEGEGDGAEAEVDAGYGLYTRVGGLKEGDLLVSIPGRLILDANTVLATAVGKALKQLCRRKKQKKQNRRNATGAEEEETVFALDEDILLRVFLWREKNKLDLKQQQRSAATATAEEKEGEEEWWQPWLRVMDPTVHGLFAAAMRVHLQWSEEEEKEEGSTEKSEQELQGRIESSLTEGTQHRAYALDFVRNHYLPLYRQWKWLQSNLFSVRKDLFPSSMPSTRSWMNYCWAAHWILSHNVKRPQLPRDKRLKAVSKALVPLVDFCNHSPMTLSTPILGDEQKEDNAHGVSISIHVHEQMNENKNEKKAEKKKRVLAMGEEVFINYGFGENALLLSHYGFALLEPPIRQLAFRVDVDGRIVERGEEKYFVEASSPTRKEDEDREKKQEDKEGMHSSSSFRKQKMELLEMIGYGSASPSSSMEELFFVRPLLSSPPSSSSIAPPENRQMLFAIIASLKEDRSEHVHLLHLLQRRTKELLSSLHSESEEEEEENGGRGGMLGCGFVDDRTMMMEEVLDDEEVIEKEIERNQRCGLQFFLTALQRWLEEQPTSIQEDEEELRILEEEAKASGKKGKHGEAERGGRVRLEEEKVVERWMVVYRLVRKRLCQEAIHCFTHCCQSL
ncbi:hypothetical protein QOT17_001181 [Balamuthia mandrillaris]